MSLGELFYARNKFGDGMAGVKCLLMHGTLMHEDSGVLILQLPSFMAIPTGAGSRHHLDFEFHDRPKSSVVCRAVVSNIVDTVGSWYEY